MTAVAAIVLAAGEGSRMGTQKALLSWQGTTLIDYQLTELAVVEAVREVIVVTGHEAAKVEQIAGARGVRAVRNAAYRDGKVGSIVAGVKGVTQDVDALMLLAVDQPRSAPVLRQLIDAHEASGGSITLPAHGGRRGHPPIFPSALRSELLAITEETQGIREIMRKHAAEIREVECDESVLIDLNEPSDVTSAVAEGQV